jgi:hypothetical protein
MSHFTVLVTKTQLASIDKQLEPFYEQGDESDYFMQREIEVEAGQYAEAMRGIAAEMRGCHRRALAHKRTAAAKLAAGEANSDFEAQRVKREADYDGYCLRDAQAAEKLAGTSDTAAQQLAIQSWHGGAWDEDGNLYHLCNPEAKWDWYSVGGRWTGYFKLKPGAEGQLGEPGVFENEPLFDADVCALQDIDWDAMRTVQRQTAEKRWAACEAALAEGKPIDPYLDFGVEPEEGKAQFLAREGSIATFAVLHSGVWHEAGQMLWWGLVADAKPSEAWDAEFERIIRSLDPDDELSVVDCHI